VPGVQCTALFAGRRTAYVQSAEEDTIGGDLKRAASIIRERRETVAFTGAGISVESGIPPFRGPDGLWTKHDPSFIELGHFLDDPAGSWIFIRELFFDAIERAEPNAGHIAVAELERAGFVRSVITQNIDGLHQMAGSEKVLEFHGTTRTLHCLDCHAAYARENVDLSKMPPTCPSCGGVLKPDFVFFSEQIPEDVSRDSFAEAGAAGVVLVVGSTGEVMPAAYVPVVAKEAGAMVVEINTSVSAYTRDVTDIFLQGKAGDVLPELVREVLGTVCENCSGVSRGAA
jgi:NAD-dependent deacetylase